MYGQDKEIRTYDPGDLKPEKKKKAGWKKGIVIFLIVVAVIVFLGVGCEKTLVSALRGSEKEEDYVFPDNYIGVLEVNGVMGEEGLGSLYNQQWLLKRLDKMEHDDKNKGLILSINTPGGSIYTVDELYLKIREYKETTGRPVYTYMRNMAASGGYYIAMASDKIYANRNTWTGSIGVTVGTFIDVSEFLGKMGIKTVTITSGANKAMGSGTDPLTDEQKAIYQGLVDEAFGQFAYIVQEGRGMDPERVRELADGRIYTARQALENGLIDEIGLLHDAVSDMISQAALGDCDYKVMAYKPDISLLSLLTGKADEGGRTMSETEMILSLMEKNNQFSVSYLADIKI